MITNKENYITVDGNKRLINFKELHDLSRKYLPPGMSAEAKDKFVDEVIFRIEELECESINTKGKSIEEYYFAACLAYATTHSFSRLYDEIDDGEIFNYCGAEL